MTRTSSSCLGAFLSVFLGVAAVSAEAVTLQPPRMVLNRSLFLEWNQASATGFISYEIHASTQQGFAPSSANRVATLASVGLHYVRLQGLLPSTRYYFRVRALSTGGTATSGEVTATTLADGVNEERIPTVMYHHVQPREQFPAGFDPGGWISTENFTRDMAYLKAHGVNAVGIEEILNRLHNGTPLPPNPVFFAFDDGYATYLQHAVPILMSNGFQSANTIVTRKTGGSSDWAVPEWPLMTLMTWTQVKDCQRQGMWMGSHTQTHVDLYLEPKKAYEITGSRDDLINQLRVHPRYFCYPWGLGGYRIQSIIDQVAAAGYTLATRTWPPDIATVYSERLWFPRVFANQNDTLRSYLVKLGLDTDKDGIKNYIEMDWGLDASRADTDGDGLSDRVEVAYDGDATTYKPYPGGGDLDARKTDTDGDGLSDFDEIKKYKTNPLKPDMYIWLDPEYVTLPSAGEGRTIQVKANQPWTATRSVDWITILSGGSGSGSGTITYSVAPNGGNIRSGTITVSGGGITRALVINQWPSSTHPGDSVDGDFDGDYMTDIAVFHPATGKWYLSFSGGGGWTLPFGWSSALPVPADYDGDGLVDFAVYHPASGNWYIFQSSNGATRVETWGDAGAVPLPGDYNGDGKADLVVFRPSTGRWSFRMSGVLAEESSLGFGWRSTIPVPADYDGDGVADVAVYHPASGIWYILQSSFLPAINVLQVPWGWSSALPVPADYDGDSKADIAVFHRASGIWYISYSGGGSEVVPFGWSTVTPVQADYDGDGLADIAVYHPASGNWYIRRSTTKETMQRAWGWRSAQPTLLYPLIHSWFHLP